MLGNSSSGLIEAPVVRLPVVNVGDRQAGRRRVRQRRRRPGRPRRRSPIALRHALVPGTREGLVLDGPAMADGRAGERVARIIEGWHPSRPPRKPPIPVPA